MKKKILLTASLMAIFDIASGSQQPPLQPNSQQQQQLGQMAAPGNTNSQPPRQTRSELPQLQQITVPSQNGMSGSFQQPSSSTMFPPSTPAPYMQNSRSSDRYPQPSPRFSFEKPGEEYTNFDNPNFLPEDRERMQRALEYLMATGMERTTPTPSPYLDRSGSSSSSSSSGDSIYSRYEGSASSRDLLQEAHKKGLRMSQTLEATPSDRRVTSSEALAPFSSSAASGSSGYDERRHPNSYGTNGWPLPPSTQTWGTPSSGSTGSSSASKWLPPSTQTWGTPSSGSTDSSSASEPRIAPNSLSNEGWEWSLQPSNFRYGPGTKEGKIERGRYYRSLLLHAIKFREYNRAYEIVTSQNSYLLEVPPHKASIANMGIGYTDARSGRSEFTTFAQAYSRGGFDAVCGLLSGIRNWHRICFANEQGGDGRFNGHQRNIYWVIAALLNYAQRIINPAVPVMFGSDAFGPAPNNDGRVLNQINTVLYKLYECLPGGRFKM